jgi:hypothetical protein
MPSPSGFARSKFAQSVASDRGLARISERARGWLCCGIVCLCLACSGGEVAEQVHQGSSAGQTAAASGMREQTAASRPENPAEPARSAASLSDSRLQDLLTKCQRDSYYDRNVADIVPILVEKMGSAEAAVQQSAIGELGATGPAAVPAIERVFRELFSDAAQVGAMQNVIGALSLNKSTPAKRLLLEALGHPHSTVRVAALRGLLLQDLEESDSGPLGFSAAIEFGPARALALKCLYRAAPRTALELSLQWLEQGTAGEALQVALRGLAQQGSLLPAAPRERLAERLPPAQGLFLFAGLLERPQTDSGEPGEPQAGAAEATQRLAREALLAALSGGDSNLAQQALQALLFARQLEWIAGLLEAHPDASLRLSACSALANALWPLDRDLAFLKLEPGPARERTLEVLRRTIDDPNQALREEAWSLLVRLGDPEAFDRALAALGESERSLALMVIPLKDCLLRAAEAGETQLAERALARLQELEAEVSHLPLAGLRLRLIQTMGLVPLRAAAEQILGLARVATGTIEGLRAHEWLVIQASNSGRAGRERLYAALFEERDPFRRLDLIWAVGSVADELAREQLTALLEDERLCEAERLFAANRLCELGPSAQVAPTLKRLAPRLQGEARRGLQCLLWRWY